MGEESNRDAVNHDNEYIRRVMREDLLEREEELILAKNGAMIDAKYPCTNWSWHILALLSVLRLNSVIMACRLVI